MGVISRTFSTLEFYTTFIILKSSEIGCAIFDVCLHLVHCPDFLLFETLHVCHEVVTTRLSQSSSIKFSSGILAVSSGRPLGFEQEAVSRDHIMACDSFCESLIEDSEALFFSGI